MAFKTKINVDAAELREETLVIKRCALVVKGGRRFSFSAYVVVGNENGVLGFGHGKATDVGSAVAKAGKDARKSLFTIETAGTTVPHPARGKFCSSDLVIMPGTPGTGVIACTPIRAIMSLAGITDVRTKSFGSNNAVNLAKAAINGLKQMRSLKTVEALRGVSIR
jgi:small subunit ribosomal protein S5